MTQINKEQSMKTFWKWIIGILIALVVVGAIVGVFFLVRTHPLMAFGPRFGYRLHPPSGQNLPNAPYNPNMPRGYGWTWRGPMAGGGRGGRPPMFGHRGFGFFPFFPFFGGFFLLGGLIKLVIFGLLLYGAYWLGRRSARVVVDPKRAAPAIQPHETPRRGRKVARNK
jgi:hypothetical protein